MQFHLSSGSAGHVWVENDKQEWIVRGKEIELLRSMTV